MKRASLIRTCISLVPIIVLVILLSLNISIFGSDSILGASQVALLFSAGIFVRYAYPIMSGAPVLLALALFRREDA